MERANLKARKPDVYSHMIEEWAAWNAVMLPESDATYTDNFSGDELADHIGATKASHKADNPTPAADPQH
jgi:hypothetical protein